MKSPNTLHEVKAFHKLFNQPVLDSPQIPDQDRCQLRINLLTEELGELVIAIANKDIIEIADALVDLQFVLSGTVLEFGLGSRFESLNHEVYRSNMSKGCTSQEEAIQTIAHHETGAVEDECSFEEKDGAFLVKRNRDKKLMKSINYSPANLKTIVEAPDGQFRHNQ